MLKTTITPAMLLIIRRWRELMSKTMEPSHQTKTIIDYLQTTAEGLGVKITVERMSPKKVPLPAKYSIVT